MVASASALESAKASKTKQDHRSTANAIHLVLLSKKKERNSVGKKSSPSPVVITIHSSEKKACNDKRIP